MNMCCVRCGNILRQVKKNSLDNGLAWTVTAGFFYLLSVSTPMLNLGVYGDFRTGMLSTGPLTLDDQGYWILATFVFLTTVCMPFLKIVGTFAVLAPLRFKRRPRWTAGLYALLMHLGPWVMIEVYLLGFLVAYSRLQAMGYVRPTFAVLGLAGLMLSIVAMDASIDPEAVWEKIRKRRAVDVSVRRQLRGCDTCYQVVPAENTLSCPRCGDVLHDRKPHCLARAWALTLAAAVLYIPSNIFPVMKVMRLGKGVTYTIFGGLQELAHVGLWPLAVLVFIASIAIPLFKLVMLTYLLIQTHRRSPEQLPNRTRLYRVLDFIGRWSMVDIFVVSILVALVRFGWLTQITAEEGAAYFGTVVILTLLAVKSFDPRLMWDMASPQPDTPSVHSDSRHSQ